MLDRKNNLAYRDLYPLSAKCSTKIASLVLYQETIKLAHQQPQLRAELLPVLRKKDKRHLSASTIKSFAQYAVHRLKTDPKIKAEVQQDLRKAGVTKETIRKIVSLEKPFGDHEFVLAVEKGMQTEPGLFSKILDVFSALLKFFGKPFIWLANWAVDSWVGKIVAFLVRAVLYIAIAFIVPRAGFRWLFQEILHKIAGIFHWLGTKSRERKLKKENAKDLADERPDIYRTNRVPTKIPKELGPVPVL